MPIHEKIFERDVPSADKYGQINFEDGQNLGYNINMGYLYTTLNPTWTENDDLINDYPNGNANSQDSNYNWMYRGAKLTVEGGYINNRGVNCSTKRSGFGVYIVDDSVYPEIKDKTDGSSIRTFLDNYGGSECNGPAGGYDFNNVDSKSTLIVNWPDNTGNSAHLGSGNDIGNIANKNSDYGGYDRNWMNSSKLNDFPAGVSDQDIILETSMVQFTKDYNSDEATFYYFIVRMCGNADDPGTQDCRNRSYHVFKLNKKLLKDMYMQGQNYENSHNGQPHEVFCWGSWNIGSTTETGEVCTQKLGGGTSTLEDNFGHGDEGGWLGDDIRAPAYECTRFAVKFTSPSWNSSDIPNYFNWIDDTDWTEIINISPDIGLPGRIDYTGLFVDDPNSNNQRLFTENDVFDFRPISQIYIPPRGSDIDDAVDLQSWYEVNTTDYYRASSPNIINLDFKISRNFDASNPIFLERDNDSYWSDGSNKYPKEIGFKFFVVDWESDDEMWDWNEFSENFPTSYNVLSTLQEEENTFIFNDFDDQISLEHVYKTPGIKIIKAVVFSYIKHTESGFDDMIQALKWKSVNIKIALNYAYDDLSDFSELGGSDYDYLPWPYTTPLIGGISEKSSYYNTVREIKSENKFNDDELFEYYKSLFAYENLPGGRLDEIGRSLGLIDLGQVRFYNKPFDMTSLLKLTPSDVIVENQFYPYYDFEYWLGDPCQSGHPNSDNFICSEYPTYPVNSFLDFIFIDDEVDRDFRNSCIIEFNPYEVNGQTIRDSSGSGNKAILMGDYSVNKKSKGESVFRADEPSIPELDDVRGPY